MAVYINLSNYNPFNIVDIYSIHLTFLEKCNLHVCSISSVLFFNCFCAGCISQYMMTCDVRLHESDKLLQLFVTFGQWQAKDALSK
jgi:hypothetical protein